MEWDPASEDSDIAEMGRGFLARQVFAPGSPKPIAARVEGSGLRADP
jgi:hypothetical protein